MNPECKPNVIWVFADQMRGQAMSCAGDPNVRTPNLDRLASEGIRFTSACSTYPLCVPFRFSALTGEYAHTRWVPALNWRMSPVEQTVAHRFNDAGYETCYVGKWHLNGSVYHPGDTDVAKAINRVPVLPGYRGGFKTWHGFNLRNNYYDTCCFHGDDPAPVPLAGYQTDALFDIAIDYIDTQTTAEKPFFMALSVEAPHPPHKAPPEYIERVHARGDLERRPNFSLTMPSDGIEYAPGTAFHEKFLPDLPIAYYAQIENLDDNIGRLMSTLSKTGLDKNTVILFFSDHGEMLGSHGFYQKQLPQEESINIPFIVRAPALANKAGTILNDPICTEDIYPTTLALAGLDIERSKPGLDLNPYLRGDITELPRQGVYLEFVEEDRPGMVFFRAAWRGLRTRTHKYTFYNGRPWQLYNLAEDPFETNNLVNSPEHTVLRNELRFELERIASKSGDSYVFSK